MNPLPFLSRCLIFAFLCLIQPLSVLANDLGFLETFALAEDRGAAVEELVPGTPGYYFYKALLAQQEERFEDVEALLESWEKRHGNSPQLQQIRHRQALLTFRTSPDETVSYLQNQLGLRFDHQKQQLQRVPDLPSQLDPEQISWDAYFSRKASPQNLSHVSEGGLDAVIRREVVLTPAQRRALLQRIDFPDYGPLIGWIAADLRTRESRGFGEFPIHNRLTEAQLIELEGLRPEIIKDQNYVSARLVRMKPPVKPVSMLSAEEEAEYLERLWTFVDTLAPAFNSLKASILYQRLDNARKRGEFPEDLFLEYLALPRSLPYVEPRYLREKVPGQAVADLRADFSKPIGLPPIMVDEPLVRDYLEELLRDADSWDRFAPFIRNDYLERVFAETKLLYGIGDAEKWYAMLSPERVEELKKRVEISLLESNSKHFLPGDEVSLSVELKHVDELIVKLYHINEFSYYRDQQREVGTDLPLDGLVPNREFSLRFDEAPMVRHREQVSLEGLAGERGIWVAELIGNGISSRALIRKGRLYVVSQATAGGGVFRVLTENNKPAEDPEIWFGNKSYAPDENGLILLPFSSAGQSQLILSGSGMSTLTTVNLPSENYQFDAGFLLSQESLLPGMRASIAVRPRLSLSGESMPLSLVEDARITVRLVDIDGIETVSEKSDFTLEEGAEILHSFLVPNRLREVEVTVTGSIPKLTGTDGEQAIQAHQKFDVGGVATQPVTRDLFLARTAEGYQLEARGRTGEPLANLSVRVSLHHRDFTQPHSVNLISNEEGRVSLGALEGITQVEGFLEQAAQRSWNLKESEILRPDLIQFASDETAVIPMAQTDKEVTRDDFAIFSLRGDTIARDLFPEVERKQGLVELSGLPSGEYLVRLREAAKTIRVRVLEGEAISLGHLLGENQIVERGFSDMLHFTAIEVGDDSIRVSVGNAGEGARVHLVATRFLPEFAPFENLATPLRKNLDAVILAQPESSYVSGRDIGEEYRYILERRQAPLYPGNMLPRAGLLLNPWALQETETEREQAEKGGAYKKSAEMKEDQKRKSLGEESDRRKLSKEPGGNSPVFTFLATQPVILSNLEIDENGVVEIDREQLRDRQHLHLLAVEGDEVVYQSLTVKPPVDDVPTRDLTLRKSLDVEESYTQQRNVTLLLPDEKLEVPDFRSARIESYSTVGELHSTLMAIRHDDTFEEFRFLANWPEWEREKQLDLYSEYACHELHFFLSRKDPEFFEEVVKPYIANKKDKTFLDHYLLGNPLARYLEPWEHTRLNLVEKILLAHRLGDPEADRTAGYVEDLVELLPPNPMEEAHRFRQALLGRRADSSSFLGGAAPGNARLAGVAFGGGGGAADAFADPVMQNELAEKRSGRANAPAAKSAPMAPAGDAFAGEALMDADTESLNQIAVDKLRDRGKAEVLFEQVETTQEWAENNYYHLLITEQDGDLIPVNAFWKDFAAWNGDEGFYSREFPAATSSFTEMMFVLSVLDLPFASEEPEISVDEQLLTYEAKSPSVVFHEEIREAEKSEEETPILVSQNFYRLDDRYIEEHGQRRDKFVTDEFLTGVVYVSQVVLTNPSSTPYLLDLLVQVPEGSLPVQGSDYTKSYPVALGPFATEMTEVAFYFPRVSGEDGFAIYPAQVAKDEKVITSSEPFRFQVVDSLSRVDEASWEYLSQEGSDDAVLDYLGEKNLQRIDLGRIAWRMKDKGFFEKATRVIAQRRAFHPVLWSYGLHHRSIEEAREFLQHQEGFLRQCGEWIETDLVSIDPVERHWYQHLEYAPLVNARSHRLGRDWTIPNDQYYQQYQAFLSVLQYRDELTPENRLAVSVYLFLQHRVEEALDWLASVDRDEVDSQLPYDYLLAYASMYREETEKAREISVAYREHPVERWRLRFREVLEHLGEIDEEADPEEQNRENQLDALSSNDTAIDLIQEGRKVTLRYDAVTEVRLQYYEMDLEFLFSSQPFVSGGSQQFSYVEPNLTQVIQLPEDGDSIDIALPEAYLAKNVLLEVVAGGERQTLPLYSNQLRARFANRYGRLEVRHAENGKALPKTYVKVYARMKDGSTRFYKDGYTDLRGKFDYVSLSTNDLNQVDRFSLLVMHHEHGALVEEVEPPQR